MSPREDGVAVKHSRTGISHHCPDLLPHVRFIAVHGTCRALRLVVPEGAFFEASGGVVKKLPAFRAEDFRSAMPPVTEDLDHCLDCLEFGLQGWVLVGHDGVPCKQRFLAALEMTERASRNDREGKPK